MQSSFADEEWMMLFVPRRYMVSDGGCRLSCKACTPCAPKDWECIAANRKAGGYLKLERQEMENVGVRWWLDD